MQLKIARISNRIEIAWNRTENEQIALLKQVHFQSLTAISIL